MVKVRIDTAVEYCADRDQYRLNFSLCLPVEPPENEFLLKELRSPLRLMGEKLGPIWGYPVNKAGIWYRVQTLTAFHSTLNESKTAIEQTKKTVEDTLKSVKAGSLTESVYLEI